MTDTIKRLRELCDAATPGEWRTVAGPPASIPNGGVFYYGDMTVYATHHADKEAFSSLANCRDVDARLIAAARNALPALIAVAEAARRCASMPVPVRAARQELIRALDGLERVKL